MSGQERNPAQISASYVLNVYEIEAGLKLAGKIKWSKPKAAVQSAFLGLGCLLFTYYTVLQPENRVYPTIAFLCAAFAAAVWLLPPLSGKRMAKAAYTGRRIEVLADEVEQIMTISPEGKEPWSIPLSGELSAMENKMVFLIHLSNGQLLILPKRAFEPEELSRLHRLLMPEKDQD